MKKTKIIQLGILVFVIGILVLFVIGLRGGNEVGIGDKAVDFELEDLNGKLHRLSDYEGKVIVLNFFATWCNPCQEQAPTLHEFYHEYKDEIGYFTIVKSDSKRSVEKYKERTGFDMPYVFDFDLTVSDTYGVIGQPETIIIDQDGIIHNHFVGSVTRDMLAFEISKLEKEKAELN